MVFISIPLKPPKGTPTMVRPYLFEKLLLGFILQQNGSVGSKKAKKQLANYNIIFKYVHTGYKP